MSKSRRRSAPAPEAAASSNAKIEAAAGPDNSLMIQLLEQAAEQTGKDPSLLSLVPEPARDDPRYTFAEDDDRKTQADDTLPKIRESHAGKEYADVKNSAAFVQGEGDEQAVHSNDVAQGSLGDCYLLASMAAVARANPKDIENLVKDNGDGTFDVTLYLRENWYSDPKPVVQTIDARLPMKYGETALYAKTGDKTDDATEMWPALLEKGLAQQTGDYDQISGGNIGKNVPFKGALELLTGRSEDYHATSGLDEDTALLIIQYALEDGQPVTCDTKNMEDDADLAKEATKQNVYGNHAYAPESVDLNGRTLDLQNPWGSSHVQGLSIKDFLRFYRSIRIGA